MNAHAFDYKNATNWLKLQSGLQSGVASTAPIEASPETAKDRGASLADAVLYYFA